MTTATLILDTPDITTDDYCVFGLATCFLKNDGEFQQVQVIEPLPSAALEAVLKGIPTSYHLVCAKSVGEILSDNTLHIPSEFPTEAQFCEDFNERMIAAVRTYKRRFEATQHIPLGTTKDNFNFSLDRKRVLNAVNVIRTEDNVKQHSHTHKVL